MGGTGTDSCALDPVVGAERQSSLTLWRGVPLPNEIQTGALSKKASERPYIFGYFGSSPPSVWGSRRIHPNRARAFAKARVRLAKSDAIDAETLATFAAFTVDEETLPHKSPQQQELAEMVSRLGQLKDQRHSESCRAKQAEGEMVRASLKAMLDFLEEQIVAVQKAIDAAIAADPVLARNAR
jgi:hypothetical protein